MHTIKHSPKKLSRVLAGLLPVMLALPCGMAGDAYSLGVLNLEIIAVDALDVEAGVLKDVPGSVSRQVFPDGKFTVPVNVVLIRSRERASLIDAGIGNAVIKHLEERGLSPTDIQDIFLTHMHFDHIEGLLDGECAAFPRSRLFISQNEYSYWSDRQHIDAYPESMKEIMRDAFEKCARVFSAYRDRLVLFQPGDLEAGGKEVAPGIFAVATYGHTPGHVSYRICEEKREFFDTGDEILSGAIQFSRPEVSTLYDMNADEAARTRRRVFAFLAESGIPFTGCHLPTPSIGRLRHSGAPNGGYIFTSLDSNP